MYQGKSLTELAAEIERQNTVKRDVVVDTAQTALLHNEETNSYTLETSAGTDSAEQFSVLDHAHSQIGARLGIPRKFYQRLQSNYPDLLMGNVNRLFRAEPEPRMVRTLDGKARAFLSNRYKRIDNHETLAHAITALQNADTEVKIESSDVTDTNLYMKAVFPRIEGDVKVGDTVQAGLILRNSEVGSGKLAVEPFIKRLVCLNGMAVMDRKGAAYSRSHLGAAAGIGTLQHHLRAETIDADTQAALMLMQDTITALSNRDTFDALLADMQATTDRRIKGDPIKAVEELSKTFSLNEKESSNVLTSLIEGADLSQWGLLNAVTDASKQASSYDRATDMEAIGGRILDLNPSQWEKIAVAA